MSLTLTFARKYLKATLLILILISVAGCATPRHDTADPVSDQLLNKVVVEKIGLDLDSPRENEGELLWNNFVNTPYETQFSKLSTRNWYADCLRFQNRLLSQAQAGGFDADSLRKILAGLHLKHDDKTARIPIGAFAARKGTEDVWIVILKWEYADSDEKEGETHWLGLSHIEVIAFRMKDGKKVDSVKCG